MQNWISTEMYTLPNALSRFIAPQICGKLSM